MYNQDSFLGKVGKIINIAATAVMMNVVFLLSCIPIVTIGQAWCGLMGAIRYNVRGEKWFEGFKIGFKTRFLRGTVAWCIALIFLFVTLMDIQTNAYLYLVNGDQTRLMPLIMAGFVFLLEAAMTTSLLALNVYIPTAVGQWLRNATNLIQKAPLQIFACAILIWVPVLLFLVWYDMFWKFFVVWLSVYFAACALIKTLLLKNPLIDQLVEARANGTLTAEEGRPIEKEEEEE